jgi:hypothetical protein
LRQQAYAGDIVLLFEDEADVLTLPYLVHVWAKKGADLRVAAPGKSKRRSLLGVRDTVDGHLLVHISRTKRSTDFQKLLEQMDTRYGPCAASGNEKVLSSCSEVVPVVLVLDNGPIHRSKLTNKLLAARPWIRVEWLALFAPELNDIERDWRHLKRHYLGNRVFADEVALENRLAFSVSDMNEKRRAKL